MESFTIDGKTYNYVWFKDLTEQDLPQGKTRNVFTKRLTDDAMKKSHHRLNPFLDLGCGFDIETSRIPNTDYSTMYVWQFSIDDLTVLGRTWDEFNEFLELISNFYKLDDKHRLLVFIHNEKFEFSFMKGQVKWLMKDVKKDGIIVDTRPDIFATDDRTVIKATTSGFIEFRDSYILTQLGLGKLAKDYQLGIEKLKGDLDYDLARHSGTKLTNQEIAYCINDVQILSAFYHKYIRKYFISQEKKIPLTMTGILRDELKLAISKLPKKERLKYRKEIRDALPNDYYIYDIMINQLFRGGYNHANRKFADQYIEDTMGSMDFKSSYPAVMLHNKFPYKFEDEDPIMFYQYAKDRKWCEDNAYWGLFTIFDVESKNNHALESKNKLVEYSDDAEFDNGRLISASWIRVFLTEQDVLNYFDFYTVDDLTKWQCETLYTSRKKPLPKVLKDMVLKYFALKETLKKGTIEYAIAKAKLNSLYGMCVSAMIYGDLRFNEEDLLFEDGHCEKSYLDACRNAFLLPQFGIWITAYSRRNLVHTFAKLEDSAKYGDTDSVKYTNPIGNEYVFKAYNDRITRMNKTMYVGEYDRKLYMKLGQFDFEGKMYRFKTLGCKRYLFTEVEYNKDKDKYELVTESTVAGMTKGSLVKYCEKNGLNPYEEFTDGLSLAEDDADKNTCKYTDESFEVSLTDYLGDTKIVKEKSCCTIAPIGFSMSLTKDYINLIGTMFNTMTIKKRSYI